MHIPVIYEDEFLIAIDKPQGIVVNRAQSVKGKTVQDWILDVMPNLFRHPQHNQGILKQVQDDKLSDFYDRAGIVHRIDKETSGILIIAKQPDIFADLQAQFKERLVKKIYLALVHGMISLADGVVKAEVGRLPWNREKFGVIAGGKKAVTEYKRMSFYKNQFGKYTLLQLFPLTGRTHQIRIHLKYLGFSIVSDKLYSGRKIYKIDLTFCPRLFLHASYIKLTHPNSKSPVSFKSDLPVDLKNVLEKMEKIEP